VVKSPRKQVCRALPATYQMKSVGSRDEHQNAGQQVVEQTEIVVMQNHLYHRAGTSVGPTEQMHLQDVEQNVEWYQNGRM